MDRFDGNTVRSLRVKKGCRREQLAVATGRSLQTIWRWERGSAIPTVDDLARLADALDAPLDAFFVNDVEALSA